MEALVSGEAGLAAILGPRVQIRPMNGEPFKAHSAGTALALFRGCSDVARIDVANVAEADALVRKAYGVDRSIRLVSIFCDQLTEDDDLANIRTNIVRLVADTAVSKSFENRLYAAPIPGEQLSKFSHLALGSDKLSEILLRVIDRQREIVDVSGRWSSLEASLFYDEIHRGLVWSSMVAAGSFKELVDAVYSGGKTDFLYIAFTSRHRSLENFDQIVRAFLQHKPTAKAAKTASSMAEQASDAEWDLEFNADYGSDHGAYENALNQQRAIIEKIRQRDYGSARSYIADLVTQQSASSGPARTAKSLCRLSQFAKQQGVLDLQLELAQLATEVFPADPQTHGHLADALIGLGQYAEAANAISALQALGDQLFANTQTARIMRLRGRWAEARELYLATANEFDAHVGVEHAWAGAAETLRDLGRLSEAISEYRALTERWPNDMGLRSGLASALMEDGQYEAAITTFGSAAAVDKSPIPRNGRATTYKLAGNLSKAEDAYREILKDFPREPVTLCGLADVLRLRGKLDEAFETYNEANKLAPHSPVPVLGLADVHRDRGDFSLAIETLTQQNEEIRKNVQNQLSVANNLRQLGSFSDALLQCDSIIRDHPHFVPAVLAKADILKRVGKFDFAIPLYNRVMSSGVMVNFAGAGLAVCLIAQGNYDRAERLLQVGDPGTQSDWQKYMTKASLLSARGAEKAALRLLERGILRCPFARLVKLMRNQKASLLLARKEHRAALRTAVRMPGEASNIVYLHALGANRRTGEARQVLRNDGWQPDVLRLGQGIARLYDFDGQGPAPDVKSLLQNEQTIIMLAA